MIQKLIDRYMERKDELQDIYNNECPWNYKTFVKNVIDILEDDDDIGSPDPDIIHEINDGDYQGTLVYLIPFKQYQLSDYYMVKVWCGSCSVCGTLQRIQEDYDENKEQAVKDLMTLSLHIVQSIKVV